MTTIDQPMRINNLTVPNRLVKAAMYEAMATENGECTEELMAFYERQAKGGAGLLLTGGAYVQSNGSNATRVTGLQHDGVIPGLKRLADHVHGLGASICLQIYHCGRQTTEAVIREVPVAPSPVKEKMLGTVPRAMSEDEIIECIEAFGQGARRAVQAGFDAVQIHAAHGYLVNQFLSPYTNKRQDRWGGSFENRMRFVRGVYETVRRAVGPDFPVLIKMTVDDFVKGGLTIEETQKMASEYSSMGFDAIELSGGMYESSSYMVRGDIPVDLIMRGRSLRERMLLRFLLFTMKKVEFEEAYFLEYARTIKPLVDVPLILVGGMRTPKMMKDILAEGCADFISIGRPLVREPGLPRQILQGREEPAKCASCNRCMVEITSKPLRCYNVGDKSAQ